MRRLRGALIEFGEEMPPFAALAGGRRRRRREQLQLLAECPLFDPIWYLETYPDVATAGVDPARHYLDTGWLEGRDPGPDFATSAYLKANCDVARQGLNPLLHFIEFGQSEGREVRGHPFAPWKRTGIVHNFGPAAPVFRGKSAEERTAPWLRHYRLAGDDGSLYSAGRWKVGYASTDKQRLQLDKAFAQLREVSGFGDGDGEFDANGEGAAAATMLDAWYVTDTLMRSRWSGPKLPFVVRAFQHDELREGELALVADEIVISPLDIVDLTLRDPYSPVLLVFAEPDGSIRGTRLLCFPSLCRGGAHYSELLALSPDGEPPDPLGLGRDLAFLLVAARTDSSHPVRHMSVDAGGADGKSLLFQPEFRRWLLRVAGVAVQPVEDRAGALAQVVKDAFPDVRPATSARAPVLASDMIPTICALASRWKGKARTGHGFAPLLIAPSDPSQPAAVVAVPADAPKSISAVAYGEAVPWPRLSTPAGEPASNRPAAIRIAHGDGPSDAELLVPASGDALPFEPVNGASVTWLVAADEWDPVDFVEAARALKLQSGDIKQVIAFIGDADPVIRKAAASLFRGQVVSYRDLGTAARSADTDFVGYLGQGVILHDARSTSVLLALLGDAEVASISCALVTSDRRGKAWQVAVTDSGALPATADGANELPRLEPQQAWRCSYPVIQPPRNLWVVRTQSARAWFAGENAAGLEGGSHVCTTLVTASQIRQPRKSKGAFRLPSAPAGRSTVARTLFG